MSAEIDRLRGALQRAFADRVGAKVEARRVDEGVYVAAHVTDGEGDTLYLETLCHATTEAAVDDLRRLMRADADGEVAEMLELMAGEIERLADATPAGLAAALRTWARKRRLDATTTTTEAAERRGED